MEATLEQVFDAWQIARGEIGAAHAPEIVFVKLAVWIGEERLDFFKPLLQTECGGDLGTCLGVEVTKVVVLICQVGLHTIGIELLDDLVHQILARAAAVGSVFVIAGPHIEHDLVFQQLLIGVLEELN